MKHLQNFERFNLKNFFSKKRKFTEPLTSPENQQEVSNLTEIDDFEEIPVRWTGAYTYNGENILLEVGDITNKGIITEIINDIHATYITDNGDVITNPEELIVYKGDEKAINRFLNSKKYNL